MVDEPMEAAPMGIARKVWRPAPSNVYVNNSRDVESGREGVAAFIRQWPQGCGASGFMAALVGLTGPRSASSGDTSKNRDGSAEFLPPVASANM